jgi:hypothetical protein
LYPFLSPPAARYTAGAPASIAAPADILQPGETSAFARFQPGYQPQQPGAPLTQGQPDDRRGILTRMIEGAQGGAGGGELGISRENIQKYPALEMLQIPARMADAVPRVFGATIGGLAGAGAGRAEHFGMSPANADRLQRDLNMGGTVASLVAGVPRARLGAPPPAAGSVTPGPTALETIGARARTLSPLEEIQLTRYNHALGTLREVQPTNPHLSALDTSTWFPQSWDIYALKQEIARLKAQDPTMFPPEVQKRLSGLDNHHPLPLDFEPEFKAMGIDPEDYAMFIDAGWHRLLDKKPYRWQGEWDDYLANNKNLRQEDVIAKLNAMMKQKPFIWSQP